PLNLEDHPKLFGLRYDQLLAVLISLLVATQLYSWMSPMKIGGQDLRMDLSILIMLIGPVYCLITLNNSSTNLESAINFLFASHIYIPGPDPNPERFLTDENLDTFTE